MPPFPVLSARCRSPYNRLLGKRVFYTSVAMRALNSNHNISHEKATRELGYQSRSFKETITDALKWFEQNGDLKCRLK
jgi:dihydroflavonol-4-reductase